MMPSRPLMREFVRHRSNAGLRGIPFKFRFEEWLLIWLQSGHFSERGRRRDQYVMARHGDRGAYESGNVKIVTNAENCRESMVNKPRLGNKSWLGRRHSEATRARLRTAERRPHSVCALTDEFVVGLKSAAVGKRDYYWDDQIGGFGVAVTDTGYKAFVAFRRWPPNNVPSRRHVGLVGRITVTQARTAAAGLLSLADVGVIAAHRKAQGAA